MCSTSSLKMEKPGDYLQCRQSSSLNDFSFDDRRLLVNEIFIYCEQTHAQLCGSVLSFLGDNLLFFPRLLIERNFFMQASV